MEPLSLGGRLDLLSLYSFLFVWKMNRATTIMPINRSNSSNIEITFYVMSGDRSQRHPSAGG